MASIMRIIGGKFKHTEIFSPKGVQTRPTSARLRESVFNICQNDIEGATFLDLFAGSGAMGLEALSRGAAKAVFVEKNRDSVACIKKNLAKLGFESQGVVLSLDVFIAISKALSMHSPYDIIYIDPPYDTGEAPLGQMTLRALDEANLLASNGKLFIEDLESSLFADNKLKHMVFKDKRKAGRAALFQYLAVSESSID